MLSGSKPEDALERLVEDETVELFKKNPQCSKELSDIIMKGLSVRVKDRYQNVEEMLSDLEKVRNKQVSNYDNIETINSTSVIIEEKPAEYAATQLLFANNEEVVSREPIESANRENVIEPIGISAGQSNYVGQNGEISSQNSYIGQTGGISSQISYSNQTGETSSQNSYSDQTEIISNQIGYAGQTGEILNQSTSPKISQPTNYEKANYAKKKSKKWIIIPVILAVLAIFVAIGGILAIVFPRLNSSSESYLANNSNYGENENSTITNTQQPAKETAVNTDNTENFWEANGVTNTDTTNFWEENGVVKKPIEMWSFTDEVPKMVELYKANHPDFDWDVNYTIIGTGDGYQDKLDRAIINGQVDMYVAEASFITKYTWGDMSSYAAAYEDLGIDVAGKTTAAQIAPYTFEIATRPLDGKVVGLGYQATGGAFIYRRSIAKDVWGSDDPATVKEKIGGGTGSWDKFWKAAEDLKAKGYGICSGDGDMWIPVEKSSDIGWVRNDKLYIDPKREEFMDFSKKLYDNGYYNGSNQWTESWYADMNGTSGRGVLGFFGPAWLINYTIAPNCGGSVVGEGTFGDWGVTESPVGFFWGGSWIMASQAAVDNGKAEGVKALLEYITLDYSEQGLQYNWVYTTGDCVTSGKVMSMFSYTPDILAGQNMFEVFVPASNSAKAYNLTVYDDTINSLWLEQVREYTYGNKTRDQAINDFKNSVNQKLGIAIE